MVMRHIGDGVGHGQDTHSNLDSGENDSTTTEDTMESLEDDVDRNKCVDIDSDREDYDEETDESGGDDEGSSEDDLEFGDDYDL